MFCKHCSYEVTEEMIVCPKCGKELSQEEDFTVALDSSEASDTEETTEVEIIAPVYHNEAMNRETKVHELQFAVKANPTIEGEPTITEETTPTLGEEEDTPQTFNKLWFLVLFIIALAAVLITVLFNANKKPNNPVKDSAVTVETTTEATEDNSISLIPTDTVVEAKPIIINEEEIEASSVKSYLIEDSDVTVCEMTYEISADDARLYMDTEETKYQLSDEILDVAYVNGVYRYHYEGIYQYGLFTDKLFVYEMPDTISYEDADKIALGLYNKEVQ